MAPVHRTALNTPLGYVEPEQFAGLQLQPLILMNNPRPKTAMEYAEASEKWFKTITIRIF